MTKIKSLLNSGGRAKTGFVSVNAKNVSPTTQTATAAGYTIPSGEFVKYDWFNVEQTSSANDIIKIPAGLPVGSEVFIYATAACEVRVSTGETINGQAATTEIAMIATGLLRMWKTTSTAWIANNFSAAAAVTAPTPD